MGDHQHEHQRQLRGILTYNPRWWSSPRVGRSNKRVDQDRIGCNDPAELKQKCEKNFLSSSDCNCQRRGRRLDAYSAIASRWYLECRLGLDCIKHKLIKPEVPNAVRGPQGAITFGGDPVFLEPSERFSIQIREVVSPQLETLSFDDEVRLQVQVRLLEHAALVLKAEYWRSVVSDCIPMLNGEIPLSNFFCCFFGIYEMLALHSGIRGQDVSVLTFLRNWSFLERCALHDCKVFAVVDGAYNT